MKKAGMLLVLALFFACVCKGESMAQTGLSEVTANLAPSLPIDSLYRVGLPRTAKLSDCDDKLAVFLNDDKISESDEDVYITSLYVFDMETRVFSKLLTTTDPTEYGWYKPAGEESLKCTLNDIHAIYGACIFPFTRKLVVSGCFDMRNTFTYIVDVDDKSVTLLPTNGGLVGFTMEEGYAIMQSYEYNTAVDEDGTPMGGRHTVLSVFDENGTFLGAMDLEQKQ